MIETVLLCAIAGTGDVWFTPRPGGDEWWVQGEHTSVASAFMFTLPPDQAAHVTGFDLCGPFDWFYPAWVILTYCDDQGVGAGGYEGGQAPDAYDGPMGLLTLDEATDLAPEPACSHPDDPAAFWLDGAVPAIVMPGEWWVTIPGDYNGDGCVNVQDLNYVLAYWDRPIFVDGYTVQDYLAVLSAWGNGCE